MKKEAVRVAKPKKKANRNVGKASRKRTGRKQSGSPAGSGKSIATGGKPARNPGRSDTVPTIDILSSVDGITAPVASELAGILASDQISPDELSMPVYGNYCGMGHGDPTGKTPPIDAVDAVYREHDLCYESLGDFDRRCDLELIGSMPDAIARTSSSAGKNAGVLALLYFSLAERNLALGKTLFKRT